MNSSTLVLLLCAHIVCSSAVETSTAFKVIRKVYDQCSAKEEVLKCVKIQALKAADRALHTKSFTIAKGVQVVADDRIGKSFTRHISHLNDTKLQKLDEGQIDDLLSTTIGKFLETHKVTFNIPNLVEESRGKKGKGHHHHSHHAALLWALAIKGSFLAMAYKGIAVMAGTALIVGKMALLLSAILGLKKLVSSGHEKTTFEIVKHPKYSESYTHSSSYEDDGHYRRAYEAIELPHRGEKVYRAYIRK